MSKLRPDDPPTVTEGPGPHAPTSHWNDLGELQAHQRHLVELLRDAHRSLRGVPGYRGSALEADICAATSEEPGGVGSD